jgi:putative ABC transport system ATP-binding protein
VAGVGVVDLLRELNAAGTTVLVITHDHEIAGALPRQVPMRDGEVV